MGAKPRFGRAAVHVSMIVAADTMIFTTFATNCVLSSVAKLFERVRSHFA
jgi:hypothetical protein